MKSFIIEKEFWEIFPDAKFGIIVCNDIDNKIYDQEKYKELLAKSQKLALNHLGNSVFSSNSVIKVWRDAFLKFKTKKGARSSIEALLKRVNKGDVLNYINPLVDLYNSISLKYGLPCGGEDIDNFSGNIKLTLADGDEHFIALGSDVNTPPFKDEIVYKDNEGAICRCWNWRESTRTMLTENTSNAFLCIELIDENRVGEFKNAIKELAGLIDENLGGKNEIKILDINNFKIELL